MKKNSTRTIQVYTENLYRKITRDILFGGFKHMQVKIRKENKDGLVKLETKGSVAEILINEDFLNPKGESIAICFKGEHSSGIVEFSTKEIEHIMESIKPRLHLIKKIKRI
jgi:galactose-1-phosphate uridylyltransferase